MSQPIFNSLGSNYSFSFALASLQQLFFSSKEDLKKLEHSLEKEFNGTAFLFYKGRDAIEFAVRVLECKKDEAVLTQAFTCHAIEEAIVRAGVQTVYVDLEHDSFNPSVETLQKAVKENKNIVPKALIIQHTLGVPAEITQIQKWCHQQKVTLIEDLAQAYGGTSVEGKELGAYGEIVICSFGRDKVVDAVAGGAVIFKRSEDIERAKKLYAEIGSQLPLFVLSKDMTYPVLTWFIRNTLNMGIGKLLFKVAKMSGWLTSPIAAPTTTMKKMPPAHAHLALRQLETTKEQLSHRSEIAEIYNAALPNKTDISHSSNLRYSLLVKDPDQLTKKLTRKNIFLTDRWYRKAVDFGSLNKKTVYTQGSCPNAEKLAQHIVNLPTHVGINATDAQRIITAIKEHTDV
jgi:perosamine synthetase